MRKAQTSEFIGIVLLIIALSFVLLFNKLGSGRDKIMRTQTAIGDFEHIYTSASITKFPYITEQGVSLSELFGILICYNKVSENFGMDNEGNEIWINIEKTTQDNLNSLYGRGKWKLEVNEYCIESSGLSSEECSYPEQDYTIYDFLIPLPCRYEIVKGRIFLLG